MWVEFHGGRELDSEMREKESKKKRLHVEIGQMWRSRRVKESEMKDKGEDNYNYQKRALNIGRAWRSRIEKRRCGEKEN